jgi:hypothetical protein
MNWFYGIICLSLYNDCWGLLFLLTWLNAPDA